jgi:predicted enzyme related to lactoylglutathione lyase
VQELVDRGVEFDLVEFGELKMVDHVLTSPGIGKSAWFKDPDGNTLALFQPE